MSYEYEKGFLKHLLTEDLYETLVASKAVLAGGALTSLFTKQKINDFDIYFKSKEDVSFFIDEVYVSQENESHSGFDALMATGVELAEFRLMNVGVTDKAALFTFQGPYDKGEDKSLLQVIHYKMHSSVQDIFNSFDFSINMAAFDFEKGEFVFGDKFFISLASKQVSFNSGTDYPLISMARVPKYVERGYAFSQVELVKMALAVSELDLSSWEGVKEQLSGMYGFDVSVFERKDEFSMIKLNDILSTPHYDLTRVRYTPANYRTVKSILSGSKVFYKKVRNMSEVGVYSSLHKDSFKYRIGEYVDGGVIGVFCHDSVINAESYARFTHNDGVAIIELEVKSASQINSIGNELTLIGKVKVKKVVN